MSDALYFIKPCKESIEKLIADFPVDDELDFD
jgi:hypothetical protein